MKKESILYGVIGLLSGIVLSGFIASYAVNNNNSGMMQMMGMHTDTNSQGMMKDNDMSMGEMTSMLEAKVGDDFDKVFIEQMIVHHQGAIDMASFAQANAKHEEVKKLADDILAAQSKEITTMKTWQTDWGYVTTTNTKSHDMMMH